jgi:hypothetical protein
MNESIVNSGGGSKLKDNQERLPLLGSGRKISELYWVNKDDSSMSSLFHHPKLTQPLSMPRISDNPD